MSFHGAHVRKAAQLNGANYSAVASVTWDQEVYDFEGWHDNSVNPSRLTVPASMNGLYARFTACISTQNQATSNTIGWIEIRKNNSRVWGGIPSNYRFNRDNYAGYTANGSWYHCSSGPILLSTGDYYEVFAYLGGDASVDIRTESGFSVYVVHVSRPDIRCAVKKAATLTNQNYSSLTAISWDTEVMDTDSIHDNVTNNTRLTVGSSLDQKYVIVHGQIRTQGQAGTAAQGLGIRKSGTSLTYDGFGGASWDTGNSGSEAYIQCCTHPIVVSNGDYFELMYANQDTTIDIEATTSAFGLYCVSS